MFHLLFKSSWKLQVKSFLCVFLFIFSIHSNWLFVSWKNFFYILIMFLKPSKNTLNSILKYTYVIFMALGLFCSYYIKKVFLFLVLWSRFIQKTTCKCMSMFVTLYMNNVNILKKCLDRKNILASFLNTE